MKSLENIRVLYVSVCDFSSRLREYKEACSLVEAGAHVEFLGIGSFGTPQGGNKSHDSDGATPRKVGSCDNETLSLPQHLLDAPFNTILIRENGPGYKSSQLSWRPARIVANLTFWNPRTTILQYANQYPTLLAEATKRRADIIHTVDLPSLEIAAKVARKLGAKLVYDSHELWSGFITAPALNADRKFAKRIMVSERRNIAQCDLVLTTSKNMSEKLEEQYGLLTTIELFNAPPFSASVTNEDAELEMSPANDDSSNGESYLLNSDLEDVSDSVVEPEPLEDVDATPVKFVYHGNMSPDRGTDRMLEVFSRLTGNWTLDIHGGYLGLTEASVVDSIRSHKLSKRPTLHGPFKYGEMGGFLPKYDVGVYFATETDGNMAVTLPNKLFDCICSGLAVAMPDFASIRRILEDDECGILLDTENSEAMVNQLQQLIDEPKTVEQYKANSRSAAKKYTWDRQGEKYIKWIAENLK